jgi:hypothetical protein
MTRPLTASRSRFTFRMGKAAQQTQGDTHPLAGGQETPSGAMTLAQA